MSRLILVLGPQLSGKTKIALEISKKTGLPYWGIDKVMLMKFGFLSGPRDWISPQDKERCDQQMTEGYDWLFELLDLTLRCHQSIVIEMPHLGPREDYLKNLIKETQADLKAIWCFMSDDSDREIVKRISERSKRPDVAPIRLEDYKIIKKKIEQPNVPLLKLDTCQSFSSCIKLVENYL
jgi:adenylate kinase family enzyme